MSLICSNEKIYISSPQDNDVPLLCMMVGLPASGKSHVADSILIDGAEGAVKPVIHSSDSLREELCGDENEQSNNADLFAELHRRIKEDLRNGKDVVYDATNINKRRRTSFLKELKNISAIKFAFVS